MMLFETIFSRLHVLLGFFYLKGGGIEAPKSRACDWWMFPFFRGIMPGQEGLTISPIKKKCSYENEEFMFSTLSKMIISRGFFH